MQAVQTAASVIGVDVITGGTEDGVLTDPGVPLEKARAGRPVEFMAIYGEP